MTHAKYKAKSKHTLGAVIAAILALAAPAQADTPACTSQWTAVVDVLHGAGLTDMPSAALVRTLADGQCRVGAITLPVDNKTTVTVKSLTWSGEGMERFVNDDLPPRTLNLAIKGLEMRPSGGTTRFRKKPKRFFSTLTGDVNLAASWAEDTRKLRIANLSLRLPQGDRFALRATAENVDFRTKANMQMSFGAFLITNVQFDFDTVGTLAPLPYTQLRRGFLGFPDDKAERVTEIAEVVDAIPAALIAPPSKRALGKLFYDMSEAVGKARIEISATPGLGLLQYGRFRMAKRSYPTPADFLATLQGVQVEVTYPTP